MSLDGLRDVYISEKRNEIATCEASRKRKLRELYSASALVRGGAWALSDEPDEDEAAYLDANDIAKRLRFNDDTLPYPTLVAPKPLALALPSNPYKKASYKKTSPSPAAKPAISLEDQLHAASASPSVATLPFPLPVDAPVDAPVQDDASPETKLSFTKSSAKPPPDPGPEFATPAEEEEAEEDGGRPTQALENEPSGATEQTSTDRKGHASPHYDGRSTEAQTTGSVDVPPVVESENEAGPYFAEPPLDGPSADPRLVVPPTADDAVDELSPEASAQDEPKPPLPDYLPDHLPPKEDQQARLKETEHKLEKAREKGLAIPNGNAPPDALSSPSSTVGPYSQATPYATHLSPDTSPDRESSADHAPPSAPSAVELDPAAQQAKEEHEHALQQQMREARERTRADTSASATPEVERQLEEEQAIRLARDGHSRLDETTPAAVPHSLTEHTEEVMGGIALEDNHDPIIHPATNSLPTPTTTVSTTTVPEVIASDIKNVEGTAEKYDDIASPAKPPYEEPLKTIPEDKAPSGIEHPTPPADVDVDVEMDDAPPAVPDQDVPRPERMTTRVSSGAIRQKSVSEIIAKKATPKAILTPRPSNISATPASPARPRSQNQRGPGQEVATVIFAKPDTNRSTKFMQHLSEEYASLQGASQDSTRDYLHGLFQYQAHHVPRSLPLLDLLGSARKTVTTAGTLAALREAQDYKILKRVYQLQNANRWSLRQIQKSAEPRRPASHLDCLLKEMKWMQTDFKEERKWKQSLAATFAGWCASYVNGNPEERVALRVRTRISGPTDADEDMNDAPTPDLMTENESLIDDDDEFIVNYPAGLFSLGFNDVVMKMDRTPASEAMLHELPEYVPSLEGASDVTPVSFCDPPLLPVSKYITGKLVSKVRGPPMKRCRYRYKVEKEPSSPPSRSGTSTEHSMPSTPGRRLFHRHDLSPEMKDVALFNPENKHVRDRLHAGHQFKPPTEYPMPSVSFFENRNSSQWLWEEDQKLRTLVKEYTFNWSLVAQELALPSMFVAGSGRRTPWECFERWVQLEGLPTDMGKTQYFRTYQTRLEQAQRTVMAQHQAQQQAMQHQAQQGQNPPAQPRRRTNQPIRVERRRDNRHLAIIEGMRKLARKREVVAHKQAESQKAALLRKAHEPAAPKNPVHTPQEFSRMKWEREQKLKDKAEQQAAQARDMQKMLNAQRMQAMPGVNPGMPAVLQPPHQQQRNATPGNGNVHVAPHMSNSISQPGHPTANPSMVPRPHPGQQAMQANFPNGTPSGLSMNNPGVPQAQMQATMQGSQRMAPPQHDQLRLAMARAQQYPPTNQHQFQLQQQQMNMATGNMNMPNGVPNMLPMAGNGMNGNASGSLNGTPNNAGSPRMNAQMQTPTRPLSSGHIPQLVQIQNSLKAQHPEWSIEQCHKTASNNLKQLFSQQQRQQAMNAAVGVSSGLHPSPQIGNNVYLQNGGVLATPSPNPVQSYQSQLLAQQRMMSMSQQQRQQASPGMNVAPMSRSATPQNPQQMGMQSPGAPQARS